MDSQFEEWSRNVRQRQCYTSLVPQDNPDRAFAGPEMGYNFVLSRPSNSQLGQYSNAAFPYDPSMIQPHALGGARSSYDQVVRSEQYPLPGPPVASPHQPTYIPNAGQLHRLGTPVHPQTVWKGSRAGRGTEGMIHVTSRVPPPGGGASTGGGSPKMQWPPAGPQPISYQPYDPPSQAREPTLSNYQWSPPVFQSLTSTTVNDHQRLVTAASEANIVTTNPFPPGATSSRLPQDTTNGPAVFSNSHQIGVHDSTFNTANTINIQNTNIEHSKTIFEELPTNNSRNIHADNCAKRTKDTCLWFIDGAEYKSWRGSSGGMMWGTGMPGAGKTVLASAVIEDLQQWAKSDPDVSVSFAFCRYTQDIPVIDILLSMIRQQAERNPAVEQAIGPIFARHKREKTRPSLDEVAGILNMLSNMFKINIYVLDGVDEAKGDVQFKLIKVLSSLRAHFFITSRPLKHLQSTMSDVVSFSIAAQDYDLELMVDERIESSPCFRTLLESNPGLREEVLLKIKEKAGGMFLHASLQMDTLRHCVTLAELRQEMKGFPEEIEDLYTATLGRVGKHPRKQHVRVAKEVLVWIIHSKTDFTIDTLRYALSFSPGKQQFELDGMIPEDTLVSLCFGLVTVDKESKLVRLVHYTAKDVLQRLLTPDFPHPHEILAASCIARLTECKFQGGHGMTFWGNDLVRAFQGSVLLEYAYKNWAFHTRQCDSQSTVWEAASRFVWGCRSYPHISLYLGLDLIQSLHVISLYNLQQLLPPQILQAGGPDPWKGLDVNTPTSTSKWTPLMFASCFGHVKMVDLLLGVSGVQVNAQDEWGNTALELASQYGRIGVVQLLLGAPEIEVNRADDGGWTPLMLASYNNHEDIAKLLLDTPGIQVGVMNRHGETALDLAMQKGHEGVAKLLHKYSTRST